MGIRRICELYDADVHLKEICRVLDEEGIRTRGPRWEPLACGHGSGTAPHGTFLTAGLKIPGSLGCCLKGLGE